MVTEADNRQDQQELGNVILDTIPEDTSVAARNPQRIVNLSSASAVASSDSSRNALTKSVTAGSVGGVLYGGDDEQPPDAPAQSPSSKLCNRRVISFSLVVVLLLAGVATGIYFIVIGNSSRNGSENSVTDPTNAPTTSFPLFDDIFNDLTASPTFSPQRLQTIDDMMKEVSSAESLEDLNSPQGTCRNWLIYEDSVDLSADGSNDTDKDHIQQRYILCVFYETTNGADWTGFFLTSDNHECSWEGISCDNNGKVARVDLPDTNLQGPLPSELEYLHHLQLLRLHGNSITGTVPTGLLSLSKLIWLDLSENSFTGYLGGENSSPLEILYLHDNEFKGSLPYFPKVERLRIQENEFDNFEKSYATSPVLESLIAYKNNFRGSLPSEWSTPMLTQIDMGSNQWQGGIPVSLWQSSNLEMLLLNNCELAGTLPSRTSTHLQHIWLHSNKLTGTIPITFGHGLANLSSLLLNDNPSLQGNLTQCGQWPKRERVEGDCNLASMECRCCTKCYG